MVDDRFGATLPQSHVQSVQHEFGTQVRGHRPTDNPAAPDIHDNGKEEKTGPRWNVCNVRHPELVWAIRIEVTVHQVWRYRCSIGGRRHAESPSHYSNQAGRSHEPCDALATNANAHVFEFGMNHRGAIRTVRALMNQSDFVGELGVRSEAFRWGTRSPCVVARLGDTERFAHDRSCMHCLVSSYESERRLGIAALS